MPKFEIGDYRHTGLQSNLYDVSQRTGQLLPNIDLKAGEVRRVGNNPVGGGPAFDIWEGEYLGREKVAIKIIRGVEVHSSERALPVSDTCHSSWCEITNLSISALSER